MLRTVTRLHPLRTAFGLALVTLVTAPGCASDDDGGGQDGATGSGTTAAEGETSEGSSATVDLPASSSGGVDDSDGGSTSADGESSGTTGPDNSALIDERPYALVVPESYDPDVSTPLVVLLHGYGATAALQNVYFRFTPDAQEHGYLLALPDGTPDAGDSQFWNATDACCKFGDERVDDVAYLEAVLDDVEAQYNVDASRVYFVGHSNGGFMAHRLACEIGDRIAAIVSLAGATWEDASACTAADHVNILQVHGTDDDTIAYDGGSNGGLTYPSAEQTVAQWATHNGCGGELAPDGTLDIEVDLEGEETQLQTYADCPPGGQVALWTIEGGGHIPSFDDFWADTVWAYLQAHPKP